MNIEAELAHSLFTAEADAIVATDRNGIIIFWNPGAARIFGFTSAEALGQSLDLIIPENQRARHWEGFRHVMQTGESRYGKGDVLAVPALVKGGSRISVEFTIAMLKDESGHPTGMVAVLRDVTRRFQELRTLRLELAKRDTAKA